EGHPIVGAKVSIGSIRAVTHGDFNRMLGDFRRRVGFWGMPYLSDVVKGGIPGQPRTVTTDADGRFRLTGIGRERLVDLHFEAPSAPLAPVLVITRPGDPSVAPRGIPTQPAEFRVLAKPARTVTGTVRAKGTGKPLAGIRIGRAVTEANGRYELPNQA